MGSDCQCEEVARLQLHLAARLRRFLASAYKVMPRRGELVTLEWSEVDFQRREFTPHETKNGDVRVVPKMPTVYQMSRELHAERRLDTHRVFLYKGKAIQRLGRPFGPSVDGLGS